MAREAARRMNYGIVINATHKNHQFALEIGGTEVQVTRLLPGYERLMKRVVLINKYSEYKPERQGTIIDSLLPGNRVVNFLFSIVGMDRVPQLQFVAYCAFSGYVFVRLLKQHREHRLDIVNFHGLVLAYLPTILLARVLGIKTFLKVTEMPLEKDIRSTNPVIDWLVRPALFFCNLKLLHLLISNATLVQVLNDDMRRALSQRVKDARKLLFLPNSIIMADFEGITHPGQKRFGYVGRLHKIKNIHTIIDGFSRVVARHPDHELLIIGEGPEEASLKAQVKYLGLETHVQFTGFMRTIRDIYARIDVLVLASFSEGCSNVILEAMASGIPIIASRVTGNRTLLDDGRTALLFSPRNAGELAEKMMMMIEDPRLREQLSSNARERVREECDASIITGKIVSFLHHATRE